jgi:hypothetical protein
MERVIVARCSSIVLALGVLFMALTSYAQTATPYVSPYTSYAPPFPRLGMLYIGGDAYMSPVDWPILGKFNVVIIGANSEGWGGGNWSTAASGSWINTYGSTRTRSLVVDGVHAASTAPGGTKVFQYVELESAYATFGLAGSTGPSGGWLDGTNNLGLTSSTTLTLNSSNTYPHFSALINKNNWWLYNKGAAQANGLRGPEVISAGSGTNNSTIWVWNITHQVQPDSTFGYPYMAAGNYVYHEWIGGDMSAFPDASGAYQKPSQALQNSSANLDGIFLDNCWYGPLQSGDWLRNGAPDSSETTANPGSVFITNPSVITSYQLSNAEFAQTLHSLSSAAGKTKMAVCNNGNWVNASYLGSTPGSPIGTGNAPADPTAIGSLYQQFEGGVDEAVIGASFSRETFQGFNSAMHQYMDLMDMMASPKVEIFNQESLQANGSDVYNSAPGQAIRYGITMALMNDGYYDGEVAPDHVGPGYIPGSPGYPSTTTAFNNPKYWWEEYDAGGIGRGYLGQPTDDANGAVQRLPRWAYGNNVGISENSPYIATVGGYGLPGGVWAREFQNGIAIVNPKGNGAVTLDINNNLGGLGVWKHFQGNDPDITNDPNDGSVVTSNLTLQDRDGIILLRMSSLTTTTVTPSAPSEQLGAPFTFTATVADQVTGGAIPAGSVDFTDSTTGQDLGTVTLDATGAASLTVPATPVGNQVIVATYLSGADPHITSKGQTVITSTCDTPAAASQSINATENTASSIAVVGSVGANCAVSDPLTYAIASNPQHGTLTGVPPNIVYTPAAGYTGSDLFGFTVSDSAAAPSTSGVSPVYINISAGTVQLTSIASLTQQSDGSYQAIVTVKNGGTAAAQNTQLTVATLGSASGSSLPASLGTIQPGGSATATISFPATAGAPGSTVAQRLTGTYSGGSFGGSSRAVLP